MIANHKGEIPIVILLLPFLTGIGLGIGLPADANVFWLTVTFLALSIVFILLNLNYSRFKLYKTRWIGGALIIPILFLFGLLSVIRHNELNNSNHFSKTRAQYLVISISNEPVMKNGLLRFTANVTGDINKGEKKPASGTLLVTIKDSGAKKLNYGDELLIPAKYNPINPPYNPAEFNYKKYLADKNIWFQAFLYPGQFEVSGQNNGNSIVAASLRLRQQLVEKLKHGLRDTDAVAVASTLILGDRTGLSEDILQAYSKTGTLYVLSVSGSQVAIMYVLLAFALGFLERHKYGKLLRATIIISIIWYYAMLTGFSLPICRVVVMVSAIIIGKTFNRYINTLNLLAVSAFVLLLYNPFFIAEAGFQVSYIAVSGLIVLQPIIYKWFKFKNKFADKVWRLCAIAIAIQAAIFPVITFYFHQFPVYFLISSLFVIIPSAMAMYLGILYLLLPQIPFVSAPIAFLLEKTLVFMNSGLAFIERLPYASVDKLWLTAPEFLLLLAIMTSAFYYLYNRKTLWLKLCLACTLLLCCSFSLKSISLSGSNTIAWLNLGKHKGIIFRKGNNAVILTDLKNTDKAYQYSIQPYLDSCEVENAYVYDFDKDINTPFLLKRSGFIQFLNDSIFIFDKQSRNIKLRQKIKTDYIYLTDNPGTELTAINRNFDYRTLVIDGSNRDNFISLIVSQAVGNGNNYKILKRNNSLISVSN